MSEPAAPEEEALPPVPVFDVGRVFRLRGRLMDEVLDGFVGSVLTGDALQSMAELLRRKLNGSRGGIEHMQVLSSVRYLGGLEVTEGQLRELAWRLAGNVDRLRSGRSVVPWSRQEGREWVPVQVVATRYAIRKKPQEKFGRSGRTVRFRVLAGTPCPVEMTQWWSHSKSDVVAGELGFTRRPPLYKADQGELMGMRFAALIDPAQSTREPWFFHVHCPPSFRAYNRALIKLRRRIGFSCPEGYEHHCFQCPVGARACPAACHPEDFEARDCPHCGKLSWFDTDAKFVNDGCINCQPLLSAGIAIKREPPPEAPRA